MKKLTVLKSPENVNYNRKHDLTNDEIRKSAIFKGHNDQEIAEVKATFKEMCCILLEIIENQEIKLEIDTNNYQIGAHQSIEYESIKKEAA